MEQESRIISTLQVKANLKQKVYDQCAETFSQIRDMLEEIAGKMNRQLKNADKRVKLDFTDRGNFEFQLKIAGDILVFSMHTNVFQFDNAHPVWKIPYVQKEHLNAYVGIISIYNFLSDSFKYNRYDDLGYLIGRIFINQDKHFIVEGKRQMGLYLDKFGKEPLTDEVLRTIVLNAINYSLEFDLLVPPYDTVKIATVGQLETKIQTGKIQTGKRLGFQFNSDDVAQDA